MKVQLKEKSSGFTERDVDSKAILNTDLDGLLKYKMQKHRGAKFRENSLELNRIRNDVDSMKNDLLEIKSLLLKITDRG